MCGNKVYNDSQGTSPAARREGPGSSPDLCGDRRPGAALAARASVLRPLQGVGGTPGAGRIGPNGGSAAASQAAVLSERPGPADGHLAPRDESIPERVLVDTSAWIAHQRWFDPQLQALLTAEAAVTHDVVIGELTLGCGEKGWVLLYTHDRAMAKAAARLGVGWP